MVSSCVRYGTLFYQHDDVTCKLSVRFSDAQSFEHLRP